MTNKTCGKVGRLRAAMAVIVGSVACAILVLSGCGGNTTQTTSQLPTEAYVYTNYVRTTSDGQTHTGACTFDDAGRELTSGYTFVSPDGQYSYQITSTGWDEFGHRTGSDGTFESGGYLKGRLTLETSPIDVNDDGFLVSQTETYTHLLEDQGDDVLAIQRVTKTAEYGNDVRFVRKVEYVTEDVDASGTVLSTETKTEEFDEDGLQTRIAIKSVSQDGTQTSMTGDITWTKDADGKPTSFKADVVTDGEARETTGDVTVNEAGLITQINNMAINGEANSSSLTVEYAKVDNPLPVACEGYMCFPLSDYAIE